MNFQNPFAFYALLSVPAIIAMYLLKQKHKEYIVPSIMLWQKVYFKSLSQKPWQKLRRNLIMALQILLALLITLALSQPFIKREALAGDIIIVLDTSLAMQATDEKPSRFEHAKERMIQFIDSAQPGTRFAVVSAGQNVNIEANFTDDLDYVKNMVKKIEVTYSSFNTAAAKNVLEILIGGLSENYAVYVFTGTMFNLGFNENYVLVGTESGNVGIMLLSHAVEPDRTIALVKLKNFGEYETKRSVTLYTDDIIYDIKDVNIEPGGEKDIFFTQAPANIERLTAKLSESDSDWLAADDTRYDVVHNNEARKCVLVTQGNIFLEKALQILPDIDLYKADPATADGLSGFFLYIFDGVLPEATPEDGHIIIINPPVENTFIETGAEIEIGEIYTDRTRFAEFFTNFEFAVSKAKTIHTPVWADRVLSADGTDLIFAGENGSRKVVLLGFDLHNSDLPLRKEFPIFIYNIISWFVTGGVMDYEDVTVYDDVLFSLYPDVSEARVVGPDDTVTTIVPPFPPSEFSNTEKPGFYLLEQRLKENNVYSAFAVNVEPVALRGVSDNGISNENDVREPIVVPGGYLATQNLKNIIIFLCLIILSVEWWVYSRG